MNNYWPNLSDELIAELFALKPKIKIYKMRALGIRKNYVLHQRLTIDLKSKIHDLMKFTEKVNGNKVATFVFDQTSRRFKVKIPNGTAIKLSPTLSWKLGYTSNCSPEGCTLLENGATANHFPILHREVHELHIYSNIIESAYAGDIKAPLLAPSRKAMTL